MGAVIRFEWRYNRDPSGRTTDLAMEDVLTSEAVIKERIALIEGDRCLAQYIVITSMVRV